MQKDGYLLGRVVLHFSEDGDDLVGELSAATFSPDGALWLGADELCSVERLEPLSQNVYGHHESVPLADLVELFDEENEVDIEGMDHDGDYLWLTGSMSRKRGKPDDDEDEAEQIEELARIKGDDNRFLLARVPVVGGQAMARYQPAERDPEDALQAGRLRATEGPDGATSNVLVEALRGDEHIGPFLRLPLPSKDNGLDVEGLVVRGNRLLLGLRGPVLRGWAVILEVEIDPATDGSLGLAPIGPEDRLYRKWFVDLEGLGIREFCWRGDDLIMLAGPTLDMEGAISVFCLRQPWGGDDDGSRDRLIGQGDRLEKLFDLPFAPPHDHAEGLALTSMPGEREALLVVYDSPHPVRRPSPRVLHADVWRLPP